MLEKELWPYAIIILSCEMPLLVFTYLACQIMLLSFHTIFTLASNEIACIKILFWINSLYFHCIFPNVLFRGLLSRWKIVVKRSFDIIFALTFFHRAKRSFSAVVFNALIPDIFPQYFFWTKRRLVASWLCQKQTRKLWDLLDYLLNDN